MTERFGDIEPINEISHEQMNRLIDRIRIVAPYANQPVDQLGVYRTIFEHPDDGGYTSIYVPVMAGLQIDEGYVDDTFRVVSRREEELDSGSTMVYTIMYGIRPTEMTTSYVEKTLVFDTETGRPIRADRSPLLFERISEQLALERAHRGPDIITPDNLRELERILDEAEAV